MSSKRPSDPSVSGAASGIMAAIDVAVQFFGCTFTGRPRSIFEYFNIPILMSASEP
jgi:hypothetical protein